MLGLVERRTGACRRPSRCTSPRRRCGGAASAVCVDTSPCAIPTLVCIETCAAASDPRSAPRAIRRVARPGAQRRPARSPRSGRRTRPLRCRAAVSCRRTCLRTRSVTTLRSSSPAAWPRLSLIALKSSRSRNSTAVAAHVATLERGGDALREESPVRQARERVVVGLVVELLLQHCQLGDRLLQPVVLEQDRSVARERGRPASRRASCRLSTSPSRSAIDDQADDPLFAAERREDRRPGTRARRGRRRAGRARVAPRGGSARRRPATRARLARNGLSVLGCISVSASRCTELRRTRSLPSAERSRISATSAWTRRRAAASSWRTAIPNCGASCTVRIDSYRNSRCWNCCRCVDCERYATAQAAAGEYQEQAGAPVGR